MTNIFISQFDSSSLLFSKLPFISFSSAFCCFYTYFFFIRLKDKCVRVSLGVANHQLSTTGLSHSKKSMKHDGSPSGGGSAAGPLRVLRVDGQVVEGGLRGAGVPG